MIEMEGITKAYHLGRGQVLALQGVSLRIERGEMAAIMGPSGSGKSTLMNIIGCLDRPTSGSYRLEGEEVSRLSDDALASVRNQKLGFVFQTYNLLPRTSALSNVELPLIYAGKSGRRGLAWEALKKVGLAQRADHRPNELSGGEQQRVAIARALINRPSLLLADEPTGNLDSRTGEDILKLFEDLHEKEGLTIVLVTHERDIALRAQRRFFIRDGILREEKNEG